MMSVGTAHSTRRSTNRTMISASDQAAVGPAPKRAGPTVHTMGGKPAYLLAGNLERGLSGHQIGGHVLTVGGGVPHVRSHQEQRGPDVPRGVRALGDRVQA